MAKQWFTTLPDLYYMRQSRRGGRREFAFTLLGLTFMHFGFFSPLRNSYYARTATPEWERTQANGHALSYTV